MGNPRRFPLALIRNLLVDLNKNPRQEDTERHFFASMITTTSHYTLDYQYGDISITPYIRIVSQPQRLF